MIWAAEEPYFYILISAQYKYLQYVRNYRGNLTLHWKKNNHEVTIYEIRNKIFSNCLMLSKRTKSTD